MQTQDRCGFFKNPTCHTVRMFTELFITVKKNPPLQSGREVIPTNLLVAAQIEAKAHPSDLKIFQLEQNIQYKDEKKQYRETVGI